MAFPYFKMFLMRSVVKKEDFAASVLTSNFLVGFFFPPCLSAQRGDPEHKASPDGNWNSPWATRTALSQQDPTHDWLQDSDGFDFHCSPAGTHPPLSHSLLTKTWKCFRHVGGCPWDASLLSSRCWPHYNKFLPGFTTAHLYASDVWLRGDSWIPILRRQGNHRDPMKEKLFFPPLLLVLLLFLLGPAPPPHTWLNERLPCKGQRIDDVFGGFQHDG